MMDPKDRQQLFERLGEQLTKAASPPFLFVGSGFSRRYLQLPGWKSLLERFCRNIRPFQYYYAKSDGNLPTVASHMALDYFEYAWSDERAAKILKEERIESKEDVLKFFISRYISRASNVDATDVKYPEEVQKLEKLSVDAIITTNWDCYLENIFPDYVPYVGQEEVVSSNPHGIGEIYKIHGCIKNPSSLVLTANDYNEYNRKYAYLAAKLVTYLVEHPIVFVGYSISDENIVQVLENLADCLGSSVQEKLSNNLILVQRTREGRPEGIEPTKIKINGLGIPITTVTTDDFGVVYDAIGSTKRKFPVKVLRFFKDEIYDIVATGDSKGRVVVADIDELGKDSDVEFVIGVGVKGIHEHGLEHRASKYGYKLLTIESIMQDIVESAPEKSVFGDIDSLLRGTIAHHLSRSENTPIFKYLSILGIQSHRQYTDSAYDFSKAYSKKFKKYRVGGSSYEQAATGQSIFDVINDNTPQKAAMVIPFLDPSQIDVDELKAFLVLHKDEWAKPNTAYHSAFRKLVSIYDRLKFGWIDMK